MTRTVIAQQYGLSLTRLLVALCTLGLSIPFIGLRRVRRTTIRHG